jgi:hypothetical protein
MGIGGDLHDKPTSLSPCQGSLCPRALEKCLGHDSGWFSRHTSTSFTDIATRVSH